MHTTRRLHSTELYKTLCNMTQRVNEDTMDFLTRCLDVKQKVIAASKIETEVKYDTALVQQMFIHTFHTGLRSDNIRHQLKDSLRKGVSDVELMQMLNKILLTESEHDSKVSVKKVNSLAHDEELSKLQKEVEQLKVQFISREKDSANSRGDERTQQDRKRTQKCGNCEVTGSVCTHCFRCGGDNHYARGCRQSENRRRPLPVGNQRS